MNRKEKEDGDLLGRSEEAIEQLPKSSQEESEREWHIFQPNPFESEDVYAWLCQGDVELSLSICGLEEFREAVIDIINGHTSVIETVYWRHPFSSHDATQILGAFDEYQEELESKSDEELQQ